MVERPESSNRVASIQKWVLRVRGVTGVTLFGFFFALTFATPQWVEHFAADFIELRVAERVYTGIDNLPPEPGDNALSRIAKALFRQNEDHVEQIKQYLKGEAQQRWAAALAQVRNLS